MNRIPEHFQDSAFWVALTFASVLVAVAFQGYWTNWAHKRVDALKDDMDDLRKKCDAQEKEIEDIKNRNPFTLLKKVNP